MFNTTVGNFPNCMIFFAKAIMIVQIMYYAANVLLLETESWSLQVTVNQQKPSDASVSKNMPTGWHSGTKTIELAENLQDEAF